MSEPSISPALDGSDAEGPESRIKSLSGPERETTVVTSDDDPNVMIWTAQRPYITRLRKAEDATEVRSGFIGTSEWAEFVIPRERWNPVSGIKRRVNMTDEKRAALADRLNKMRERQSRADDIPEGDDE